MIFKNLYCWILLAVLLTACEGANSTECTEKTKSVSYLDIAVEMINKAKEHIPSCPNVIEDPDYLFLDCEQVLLVGGSNKSGTYHIWPHNRILKNNFVEVYCDMDTDGGGWTVIQRRGNYLRPKEYFYQDWSNYKTGFGDIEKDFWLGNDNIYALTNQREYSVRFDMKAVDGEKKYAFYDTFWIESEAQQYTLHIKDYSGDAGDSMATHDNMKFSTKDADNDLQNEQHCAQLYKGGWWYNNCHLANLNGLYLRGKHDSFADGVNWKTWREYHESLDTTEIKIRPKNFRKQVDSSDLTQTPKH